MMLPMVLFRGTGATSEYRPLGDFLDTVSASARGTAARMAQWLASREVAMCWGGLWRMGFLLGMGSLQELAYFSGAVCQATVDPLGGATRAGKLGLPTLPAGGKMVWFRPVEHSRPNHPLFRR